MKAITPCPPCRINSSGPVKATAAVSVARAIAAPRMLSTARSCPMTRSGEEELEMVSGKYSSRGVAGAHPPAFFSRIEKSDMPSSRRACSKRERSAAATRGTQARARMPGMRACTRWANSKNSSLLRS